MSKKKLIILTLISIICVVFVPFAIIEWHKHKALKELSILKAYNDSIFAKNEQIIQYAQFSIDSINNENCQRLQALHLVSELHESNYNDYSFKKREFKENWENLILDLGFERQEEVVLSTNCSEYDDELYDVYGIPYVRILNDRTITITPEYRCNTQTQDGVRIAEKNRQKKFQSSIEVKFSSKDDFDNFLKSLYDIGFVKQQQYDYRSNNVESTFYSDDKTEVVVCPSICVWIRDELTLTIVEYQDC